jgi:hypothetical protein
MVHYYFMMNCKIKFSLVVILIICKLKYLLFIYLYWTLKVYIIINKVNENILCDEYDKLLCEHLTNGYNRLVRPVIKNQDSLPVNVDLKLSRLIDIVNI